MDIIVFIMLGPFLRIINIKLLDQWKLLKLSAHYA